VTAPHPLTILGGVALIVGCLAWPWTGEWRWAVTGLGVLLVLTLAGSALDRRARRSDRLTINDVVSHDGCWHDTDTVHCGCGRWSVSDPDVRRRFDLWMQHRETEHT
jgi:hypothetical protein